VLYLRWKRRKRHLRLVKILLEQKYSSGLVVVTRFTVVRACKNRTMRVTDTNLTTIFAKDVTRGSKMIKQKKTHQIGSFIAVLHPFTHAITGVASRSTQKGVPMTYAVFSSLMRRMQSSRNCKKHESGKDMEMRIFIAAAAVM
jgi:hypothetical protein